MKFWKWIMLLMQILGLFLIVYEKRIYDDICQKTAIVLVQSLTHPSNHEHIYTTINIDFMKHVNCFWNGDQAF